MRRALSPLLVLLTLVAPLAAASESAVSTVSSTRSTPLGTDCRDGPEAGRKALNSEVEPMVAVDPTDPRHFMGTYQQDRWSNGGARGVVVARSMDGGESWLQHLRTKTSFCTGGTVRNGGDFERATDPWVTFAPDGDLYLMTLSLSQPDHAMLVTKFDEDRNRWGRPKTLIREKDPSVLNDKNSITADPNEPDGSHVYAVWDRLKLTRLRGGPAELSRGVRGPILFARTADGGATWSRARTIFDPGELRQTLGNQIVVSPDLNDGINEGQVVNVFTWIFNLHRRFQIAIIRSFDQGRTWSEPIIVDRLVSRRTEDPDPDRETRRDRIRGGGLIPDADVDPMTGNLYMVWQDSRFNEFDYDGIVFSESTDGGTTWSEPVEINKTPDSGPLPNRQAFTPTVAVAPDGTVAVTYYDFRNNNTADHTKLETDYWLVHCNPLVGPCTSSDGWTEIGPLGGSFDMKAAPYARGYFTGDYQALAAIGPRTFLAFFSRAIDRHDPATVYSSVIAVP